MVRGPPSLRPQARTPISRWCKPHQGWTIRHPRRLRSPLARCRQTQRAPTANALKPRRCCRQRVHLRNHWTKLSSTNSIERTNAEIKRRTDVVGIFPNEAAITRLVGAILMEQNDEWAVQRCRYMTLATISEVSEDNVPLLTAVAS